MSIWCLYISDIHVGSAFSLWNPDTIGSAGSRLNLNTGQKYLWDNWQRIIREVKSITGGKLDILATVGDAIHGKNKKNDGEYLVEPDMAYQSRGFIDVVYPLREIANQYYQFRGSGYHVGNNAESEEWIAQTFDAMRDDFGHYCWMWLPDLEIGGVVHDLAHHQSAVMVNKAMPLERERRFSNNLQDIKRYADVIIRAHAHTEALVVIDGEWQIGLPAMQLQTPYAKMSKVPNRMLSRYLGVCLVEIIPGNKGTVLPPINPRFIHFKHPPLPQRTYKGDKHRWQKKLLNRIFQ
jgi:hypothetical protein